MGEKGCSLMSEDQCTDFKACLPSEHEGFGCATGDLGCVGGEMPPSPSEESCRSGIVFNNEVGTIHWACVNPHVPHLPSPYNPDNPTIPADTMCFSTHR